MSAPRGPIVVGYLDTPEGRAALAHAIDEAQRRSVRLVVVHSTVDENDPGMGADLNAQLAAAPIASEVREVKGGREVSDAILAVVDQVHAGLLVIGLRRRSPVGKFLLGSNAQQILLDADCPVLAVKAS